MKERLIVFTRNKENVKKVSRVSFISSLLILIMHLFAENPIVTTILFIALIIDFSIYDFIKFLSEENENVIRNNYLITLLAVNPYIISTIIILILLIITDVIISNLCKVGVYTIKIGLIQFIIGIILFIILIIILATLIQLAAYKISAYLRKVLLN